MTSDADDRIRSTSKNPKVTFHKKSEVGEAV